MRTRNFHLRSKWAVLVASGGLLVAGCDSGPLQSFAGGSNSKDKAPIPPAVNASSTQVPGPAASIAASPTVQGPVAADKSVLPHIALPPDDQALRESSEEYRAGRERDPFLSLLAGHDYKSELVDPSIVRLVGIVRSGERPFCVVEDPEGISSVLYVGDPVRNGRVVAIKADTIVCSQTVLGYTNTVQLKLEERKGVKNG